MDGVRLYRDVYYDKEKKIDIKIVVSGQRHKENLKGDVMELEDSINAMNPI